MKNLNEILQEILILTISQVPLKTRIKNGIKEIDISEWGWKDNWLEIVDLEKKQCVVREYYKNGNKWWEQEYQNGKRHGKSIGWYKNGNKSWKIEYQNGKRHGKSIRWYKNGNKWREEEYQNGELVKKIL